MTGAAQAWRVGENLPWTAPWTGEGAFELAPSRLFPGLAELIQREAPGEGEPQFRGMNLMRQRRGVIGHLCQVCGAPTPAADRWLFPTVTGTFIRVKGRTRYASHMPPTHRDCAARARRLCPHLRAALAAPAAFPRDEGFVSPETSLPDTLAHLAARLPAGGVAYTYVRVYGDAFTRLVTRLRGEAPRPA